MDSQPTKNGPSHPSPPGSGTGSSHLNTSTLPNHPRPLTQPSSNGQPQRPSSEFYRRSSDTHQRATSLHTVRGFTPEPTSPLANHSNSIPNRTSSLSASLASSSFHYPNRDPSVSSTQESSNVDFVHRVDAQSTPGASVLNFKRKTDDSMDLATSYRFFMVEEQMQKRKQNTAGPTSPPTTTAVSPVTNTAGPIVTKQPPSADTLEKQTPTSPTTKSKPKRVTFDPKPDVVNVMREVEAEKVAEAAANLGTQELVFDIEDDDPGYASGESSMPPFLREPIVAPHHSSRTPRKSDNSGLSASYQAVRPSSLPSPSALAAYRPSTLRAQVSSPLSQPPSAPTARETKRQEPVLEEPKDPRDSQLLKLVAAHVPSHRGAWTPGSKEWDSFIKRPDNRSVSSPTGSDEGEVEGDVNLSLGSSVKRSTGRPSLDHEVGPTFVGSLPVAIKPFRAPKEELSLASYRPKTAMDGGLATSVPTISHRRTSSAALRRASYAERDRSRPLDPGHLAFAVDDDSEEGENENDNDPPTVADKGSRFALRILHARNSVPEAGVWRSLASS